MNGKKIGNLIFYIIGSCIMISISVVIVLNVINDSRLFGATYDQASVMQQPPVASKDPNVSTYDTFKYNRTFTPDPVVDEEKITKVTTASTISVTSMQGITVELISYVKVDGVAESLKEMFESKGFVVTLTKPNKRAPYTTRVIEHNDKGVGNYLYKILKAGVIIKDFKERYAYDLTVILGEDYNP